MVKILLLIDFSSEFTRGILKGLIRYSKDHGPWIFYRLPSYYKTLYGEKGVIQWAKEWEADAIIARWDDDDDDTNLLTSLNIPVILQNYRSRSDYFTNLLLTTNRPLFDIALESGFNDYKNISRLFKKMKGYTPSAYREKFRDKDISNVF